MTNIGHFRAAGKLLEKYKGSIPTRMWIVPPTRMDEHQLMEEGYYNIYGRAGARTEMPGCSLCMGNQARVAAELHRALDLDAQLPEPPRRWRQRVPDLGGAGRGRRDSRPPADPRGVHGVREEDRRHGERNLPLHELRPDREFQKSAEEGKRIAAVEITEVVMA